MKFFGAIKTVTFSKSDDNGYFYILKVLIEGISDIIAVTGSSADRLNAGSDIIFDAEWITHSSYGKQLKATFISLNAPTSVEGVRKYLSTGNIKGVGEKTADKLVAHFGDDLLNVLNNNPERLKECKINTKQVNAITNAWVLQSEAQESLVFLLSHGIGNVRALKIYKTYGTKTISIVQQNPYKLIKDFHGISFKIADTIALSLGFKPNSEYRVSAGIMFVLQENENFGNVAIRLEDLEIKLVELEITEKDVVRHMVAELSSSEELVIETILDENFVYRRKLYAAEIGTASILINKIAGFRHKLKIDIPNNSFLSTEQKDAVIMALSNPVTIITGGAGVGKTTVLKEIINQLVKNKKTFSLAAPTGRASKRMSESTGHVAKTIHRLINIGREELHEVQDDYLIIDEASMLDQMLMFMLLSQVSKYTHLVFVGDVNQLPSVGAGIVLRDMIDSNVIPIATLTKIFRQGKTSDIILHSHSINAGYMPTFSNGDTDFRFIPYNWIKGDTTVNNNIIDQIISLLKSDVPLAGFDPIKDVQVLSPMRANALGTRNLNTVLQATLNPIESGSIKYMDKEYRVNDKVMQIRNNYDKEVFNGDIGYVSAIDTEEDKQVIVTYDERSVVYEIDELDQLDLAYAITIHKSQGSEYPVVIIPMTTSHFIMLERNLLYTGVTRGKKLVYLLGHAMAVKKSIETVKTKTRITHLNHRLTEE